MVTYWKERKVFSDVCRNLDPPYEIICVTSHKYFNRKQYNGILEWVFVMNTNCGYIDYELMNAEILAFGENGVVNGVDPDVAEQDNLLPYEIVFLWIKGNANSYSTTPVHEKCVIMRLL